VHLERWFFLALGLLVVSFALFALPSQIEGPVLLRISPGHAIAVLDAVAIVPLLIASALLYGGIWGARSRLLELTRRHPGRAVAVGFAGGLGLGLLFASVFSTFAGWWAVGAVLFSAVVVAVSLRAARK
jgi:hypothetical protein